MTDAYFAVILMPAVLKRAQIMLATRNCWIRKCAIDFTRFAIPEASSGNALLIHSSLRGVATLFSCSATACYGARSNRDFSSTSCFLTQRAASHA